MWQCGLGSLRALQAREGCAGKGRGQPPGKGTVGGPQLCFLPTAGEGNSCREGPTGVSRAGGGAQQSRGESGCRRAQTSGCDSGRLAAGGRHGLEPRPRRAEPSGVPPLPAKCLRLRTSDFRGPKCLPARRCLTTRCAERVAEGVGDLGSPLTQHRSPKVPSRGPWDLRGPSEQRPPLNSLTWLTAGASRWPAGAAGGDATEATWQAGSSHGTRPGGPSARVPHAGSLSTPLTAERPGFCSLGQGQALGTHPPGLVAVLEMWTRSSRTGRRRPTATQPAESEAGARGAAPTP